MKIRSINFLCKSSFNPSKFFSKKYNYVLSHCTIVSTNLSLAYYNKKQFKFSSVIMTLRSLSERDFIFVLFDWTFIALSDILVHGANVLLIEFYSCGGDNLFSKLNSSFYHGNMTTKWRTFLFHLVLKIVVFL